MASGTDFKKFARHYRDQWVSHGSNAWSAGGHSPWLDEKLLTVRGYRDFAERFAGVSFDRGLYRVHDSVSGPLGLALIRESFPAYENSRPFSYDWQGRQYVADFDRFVANQPMLIVLDPETEDDLEVPGDFMVLHERELTRRANLVLDVPVFLEWLDANVSVPRLERDQCVGMVAPPNLGGEFIVENLELTSIEVHWGLSGQLHDLTRDLPEGTIIGSVQIDDNEST